MTTSHLHIYNGWYAVALMWDGDGHLGIELATTDGSSCVVVRHTPDGNGHFIPSSSRRDHVSCGANWSSCTNPSRVRTMERPSKLGRHAYHRFGLTLARYSQTVLWLDQPESGHTWLCGPAASTRA